jgi:hypothetical protein
MKIIISEDQKKKLFIPRRIDERDRQYLSEIGMNPVLQYIKDNETSVRFDMSTTPDEWNWYLHGVFDGGKSYYELNEFETPVKKLIEGIANEIDGIFHIWGDISITEENKLFISFDYEVSELRNDSKTYKL